MSESIGLSRVHNTIGVFGRRVHREQFQGSFACIDKVVIDSGGHGKQIASANIMGFTVDNSFAFSFDKRKHLVVIFVNFLADVFTGKDAHQHHLGIFIGNVRGKLRYGGKQLQ